MPVVWNSPAASGEASCDEKIGDNSVPNYSGSRYVGSTVFIKLRMRGWRAYEERCMSTKVVGTMLRCDLYDTERTLASWRK